MKLSIGIVGLPNVGKSTLLHLITKNEVKIANYPFATIDPNIGIVNVPDDRLDKLSNINNSLKIIPAIVEFYDIAGIVKGASKGEGLGNKFLRHIKETNAIAHVVRCFKESDIIHVENRVNPLGDIEIVNTELKLKDIETVEKRLSELEREGKSMGKTQTKDIDIMKSILDILNNNETIPEDIYEEDVVTELNLLSVKKQIYILNGIKDDVDDKLIEYINKEKSNYVIIDLKNPEQSAMNELIKNAYSILGLISFFTSGEKETRAWTIKNNTKLPQASGVIHTDFENKFIRAEVIDWKKLVDDNGWVNAHKMGDVRIEGKDYIVKDGDVIIVRHG